MTSSEVCEMVSLNSDESDQEDELPAESCMVSSTKLKAIHGVEYQPFE